MILTLSQVFLDNSNPIRGSLDDFPNVSSLRLAPRDKQDTNMQQARYDHPPLCQDRAEAIVRQLEEASSGTKETEEAGERTWSRLTELLPKAGIGNACDILEGRYTSLVLQDLYKCTVVIFDLMLSVQSIRPKKRPVSTPHSA